MGGGIYSYCTYPNTTKIENVVCFYNKATGAGSNAVFNTWIGAHTGYYHIVNSCVASTNTFLTTSIAGYYYANNIESDPQFVNKDSNDFNLAVGSPCLNAGTNESWMNLDFDNHSRIDRFSGVVDMGCYEYISQGIMFSVP